MQFGEWHVQDGKKTSKGKTGKILTASLNTVYLIYSIALLIFSTDLKTIFPNDLKSLHTSSISEISRQNLRKFYSANRSNYRNDGMAWKQDLTQTTMISTTGFGRIQTRAQARAPEKSKWQNQSTLISFNIKDVKFASPFVESVSLFCLPSDEELTKD